MSNRDVSASEARLPQTTLFPSLSSLSLESVMSIDGKRKRTDRAVGTPEDKVKNNERAVSIMLGIIELDPQILITLRGLIQELQLCQLSTINNEKFHCNDKDGWRRLLVYAENNTRVNQELVNNDINPFSSVQEVDQRVIDMNDHNAANEYKEEFRKYVIFRSITGLSAYNSIESYRDDLSYMFMFEYQLLKFLGRKNGGIQGVITAIKYSTAKVREGDTDFPPVPAGFFVTAVDIVVKIRSKDRYHSAASKEHIQELKDTIMQQLAY